MEKYKQNNKLADVLLNNHLLLPVIGRFGIRLGIKDKTIEEICEEKNIDTRFFLAIINTYTNENYFPEKELLSFSPMLIIDYLQKTHRYYIEYLEPQMQHLLNAIIEECQGNCEELQLIKTFYLKYIQELYAHIEDEEKRVFPYVETLFKAHVEKQKLPEEYRAFSIATFEKEHTNVDHKLNDLKNLIIRYIAPNYDANLCNEFLTALFTFEKDIKDHARVEDKILIPQVVKIEKLFSHE